ncbi:MAG: hypothetical protein AB7I30_16700 [Isosphaeraceae bacterium]
MRLWHMLFLTAGLGLVMALARDPHTRVLVIVLGTGIGLVGSGLLAVMTLFQTVGSIGDARGLGEHAEAIAATTVVLTVSSVVMSGVLFVGFWLVAVFT